MIKKWLALLLVFVLGVAVGYQGMPQMKNCPENALLSSPRIVVSAKDGQKAGAGIVWRESEGGLYVLTCAHLLCEEGDITVFPFGYTLPQYGEKAQLIGTLPDYDLALLEIPKTPHLKVAKGGDTPVSGTAIFALGNPLGKGSAVGYGVISAPYEAMGDEGSPQYYHRLDCHLEKGNSGGGVYDSEGNVVGMVMGKVLGENGIDKGGYAMPWEQAQALGNAILAAEDGIVKVAALDAELIAIEEIREGGEIKSRMAFSYISPALFETVGTGDRLQ
ncbi:MAG: trypsin-like peptidase domain-containing protein, partial [Clostridia bacterium]|nr:trypsin-like peptidase domain-containing protein [Clostridia bacterium]